MATLWRNIYLGTEPYRRMKITGLHKDVGYNGVNCPLYFSRLLEAEDILTKKKHVILRPHELWVWNPTAGQQIGQTITHKVESGTTVTYDLGASHSSGLTEGKFIGEICDFGKEHYFSTGTAVKLEFTLQDNTTIDATDGDSEIQLWEFDGTITNPKLRNLPDQASKLTNICPAACAATTTTTTSAPGGGTTTTAEPPKNGCPDTLYVHSVDCYCFTLHKTIGDADKGINPILIMPDNDEDTCDTASSGKGMKPYSAGKDLKSLSVSVDQSVAASEYREDCHGRYKYYNGSGTAGSDYGLIEDNKWAGSLQKIDPPYDVGNIIYVRPLLDPIKTVCGTKDTQEGPFDPNSVTTMWCEGADADLYNYEVCAGKNVKTNIDCVNGDPCADQDCLPIPSNLQGDPLSTATTATPTINCHNGTVISMTEVSSCTLAGAHYQFVFLESSLTLFPSCYAEGEVINVTYPININGTSTETKRGTITFEDRGNGKKVYVTLDQESTSQAVRCDVGQLTLSPDATTTTTASPTTTTTSGGTTTTSGGGGGGSTKLTLARGVIFYEDINVIGRKRSLAPCIVDKSGGGSGGGSDGYQGYQGYQGHQGYQGFQGHQGHQGKDGASANIGYQGYQGKIGLECWECCSYTQPTTTTSAGTTTTSSGVGPCCETITAGAYQCSNSVAPWTFTWDTGFNLQWPCAAGAWSNLSSAINGTVTYKSGFGNVVTEAGTISKAGDIFTFTITDTTAEAPAGCPNPDAEAYPDSIQVCDTTSSTTTTSAGTTTTAAATTTTAAATTTTSAGTTTTSAGTTTTTNPCYLTGDYFLGKKR